MSQRIYDYDKCYEVARQCSYSTEMQQLNGTAYNVARKNGWLKDYTWFIRKHHTPYTYEEVYDIAKNYTCSSEFQKNNGSAYGIARANDWIKDYHWFKPKQKENGFWNNHDKCFDAALKCKTATEFIKKYPSAYKWAVKNKWYPKEYTWFIKTQKHTGYWNKERVAEESKKYKSRGEFALCNGSAYGKARQNKWLDEFTWLKDERIDLVNGEIDCVYAYEFEDYKSVYIGRTLLKRYKERDYEHIFNNNDTVHMFCKEKNIPAPDMKILESGLTISQGVEKEEFYVKAYRENGWTILNRAKTGSIGLLAKNKWTKESCYQEALKYKTRGEFAKLNGSAYDTARRNGWLNDYTWFEIKQKPANYWNDYDRCFSAAKSCQSKTEFIKKYSAAYCQSKKNDWIKDYTWFN